MELKRFLDLDLIGRNGSNTRVYHRIANLLLRIAGNIAFLSLELLSEEMGVFHLLRYISNIY